MLSMCGEPSLKGRDEGEEVSPVGWGEQRIWVLLEADAGRGEKKAVGPAEPLMLSNHRDMRNASPLFPPPLPPSLLCFASSHFLTHSFSVFIFPQPLHLLLPGACLVKYLFLYSSIT